jgi:4-diphosphocytidyl-2-C-methyl-D-erythritol kinase
VSLECRWAYGLPQGGRQSLACPWGDLPTGSENIVVRAVELGRTRAGVNRGAKLRLVKRIPSAAGLGGGSSDAAAALLLVNTAWRLGWTSGQLMTLAAELGSDVPFFIGGGAAICRGRGERIEPVVGLGRLHFVVVRPPAGLSTRAVYGACRAAAQPRRAEPLVAALRQGDRRGVGQLLHNGLQPAAESLSPWIARLREEFAQLDFLGHQMSGSGTSYFGLCRHARQARHLAGRLQSRGVGQVYALAS